MRLRARKTLLGLSLPVAAFSGLIWLNGEAGSDWLAAQISSAASSEDLGVRIGGIDHLLSSKIIVRDVALSDAKGAWLRVDSVTVEWSRLWLLRGVAKIDEVQIGRVEILRKPMPSRTKPSSSGPLIPELPVDVRLNAFTLDRLEINEAVAGVAASFTAKASAQIDRDRIAATILAQRQDGAGEYHLDANIQRSFAQSKVDLRIAEPEGGLIALLADIEDLPAISIDMQAAGGPDDFTARLNASGGASLGATGEARVKRDGAGRDISINLDAAITRLLPPAAAALLPGKTRVTAQGRIEDNGDHRLDSLKISNDALVLDASGVLLADGKIDVAAKLNQAASGSQAFSAKALQATLRATGTVSQPNILFSLNGEQIVSPAGTFGLITLDARTTPASPAGKPVALTLDAAGRKLAFADKALADIIGSEATAKLAARFDLDGQADVSLANLKMRAGQAEFSGKAGLHDIAGRLSFAAPDLAIFARLSGRKTAGALSIAADLTGAPAEGRLTASVSGGVDSPRTGLAALDGLLGEKFSVAGAIALSPDSVSFSRLGLSGEHAKLDVDGALTSEKADISVVADIPDLEAADDRLSGRARLTASLTGPQSNASGRIALRIENASAEGRAIPQLVFETEARNVFDDMAGRMRIDGTVDGKAAKGTASFSRTADALTLSDLDIAIGRATMQGSMSVTQESKASGRIRISAPDLNDLSTFAMTKLAGRLDADIALESSDEAQHATIVAKAEGVRAPQTSIDKIDARFTARDIFRRPGLDGEISISNARVAGENIPSARLSAKPGAASAIIDLAATARGFNIQGRGELTPAERSTLKLATLSAKRGAQQFALARPATLTFGEGDVLVKDLSVSVGSGRIDVDGAIGRALNLTARMKALPLSMAALVEPDLKLEGVAEGEARLGGTTAAPTGDWKIALSRFSTPETRNGSLPPINVTARGRLTEDHTTLDADISMGPKSRVTLSGSAPLSSDGELDIAAKGTLDASLANAVLAAGGQSVKGRAQVDLRVEGKLNAPTINGHATIAEGAFEDPLAGLSIRNIRARIEARDREIEISSFSAEARNGGKISLGGHVSLLPEKDFPGAFRLTTRNARLINSDTLSATADVDLELSGALARTPRIAGKIALQSMDVAIPDRLPANLKPIPGTTHIDARGFARQMLELEKKQKQKKAASANKSPFDAALDLTITAPSRIFVRGRGIDAEFGGELSVKGSSQKPAILGGFDLRRGKLDMLTQRIAMTRGKLNFEGALVPNLDFAAETAAGDVTATVNVTGPADAPSFAFASSPELPQDEVLARLLFKKAAASLTPVQAVQLATAIAQFSGAGAGVDAFEKMRRALGVDALDIDASGPNGPKVGASRYLTSNVSVGVKTGTKPEESSVNVGIDLFRGVRAQAETSMDGKSSVGIGFEFEY
jgi:translocation and assembly module TamB